MVYDSVRPEPYNSNDYCLKRPSPTKTKQDEAEAGEGEALDHCIRVGLIQWLDVDVVVVCVYFTKWLGSRSFPVI